MKLIKLETPAIFISVVFVAIIFSQCKKTVAEKRLTGSWRILNLDILNRDSIPNQTIHSDAAGKFIFSDIESKGTDANNVFNDGAWQFDTILIPGIPLQGDLVWQTDKGRENGHSFWNLNIGFTRNFIASSTGPAVPDGPTIDFLSVTEEEKGKKYKLENNAGMKWKFEIEKE